MGKSVTQATNGLFYKNSVSLINPFLCVLALLPLHKMLEKLYQNNARCIVQSHSPEKFLLLDSCPWSCPQQQCPSCSGMVPTVQTKIKCGFTFYTSLKRIKQVKTQLVYFCEPLNRNYFCTHGLAGQVVVV